MSKHTEKLSVGTKSEKAFFADYLKSKGFPISSTFSRVTSGRTNTTYRLDGGFIAKFYRNSDSSAFHREIGVMKRLEGLGIAPKIAFVESEVPNIDWGVCVMEELSWTTLARRWPFSDEKGKDRIMAGLSNRLRWLHELPVGDFAFLNSPGEWTSIFEREVSECFHQASKDPKIDQEAVSFLKKYYETHKDALSKDGAFALVHGDIHFENVLVDGDEVSWLLDFELASVAPVDFELAKIVNFCFDAVQYVEPDLECWYEDFQGGVLDRINKTYPEVFGYPWALERLRLFLIPDILWGFKSGYVPKYGQFDPSPQTVSRYNKKAHERLDFVFGEGLDKKVFRVVKI